MSLKGKIMESKFSQTLIKIPISLSNNAYKQQTTL